MLVHRAVWFSRQPDGSVTDGAGIEVTWRPLSWKQYRRFEAQGPLPAADIYEACLLSGPSLDNAPAGIVRWIAEREMASNPFTGGFAEIKRSLDQARQKVRSSYLLSARAVIAGALHYRMEEMDDWTAELFFERLAQAELLIKAPLEPVDPSAPAPVKGKRGPAPSRIPASPDGSRIHPVPEVETTSSVTASRPSVRR